MALEMRGVCERCGNALSPAGKAYIWAFDLEQVCNETPGCAWVLHCNNAGAADGKGQ